MRAGLHRRPSGQRTQAEWVDPLRGHRRLRGRHRPVLSEAVQHPHLVARGTFVEHDGPGPARARAALLAHRAQPRPAAARDGRPAHPGGADRLGHRRRRRPDRARRRGPDLSPDVKPFLFLGIRAQDAAADDEYAAVLRCAGLDERDVRRVRLEREALGPRRPRRLVGDHRRRRTVERQRPAAREGTRPAPRRGPAARPRAARSSRPTSRSSAPATASARSAPWPAASSTAPTASRSARCAIDADRRGPRGPAARRPAGPFTAFLGHKEAVSRLPDGAVLLASSATCPVQAFRIGANVYATQFHPELDVDGHRHAHRGLPALRLLRAARGRPRSSPRPRRAIVTEPPRILERFVELFARD